jgi:C4-dicarboxylate-specific signal transduction histidine kinase
VQAFFNALRTGDRQTGNPRLLTSNGSTEMAWDLEVVAAPESFDAFDETQSVVDWEQWSTQDSSLAAAIGLEGESLPVVTDRTAFRQIVLNMVRNAREASGPGDSIRVRVSAKDAERSVAVWNRQIMPPEVKWQVFQCSFSTKGSGRGLDTYGMSLLETTYLDGSVKVDSCEGFGTEFMLLFLLTQNS